MEELRAPMHHHTPAKYLILTGCMLIAVLFSIVLWPGMHLEDRQVFCTQEAKQCPDGSYVGRRGPNCEFAECPSSDARVTDTKDWKTYHDDLDEFMFQYPADWYIGAYGKGESSITDVRNFSEYGEGGIRPQGGLDVTIHKGCDDTLNSNGFVVQDYGAYKQLEKSFCQQGFQVVFELDTNASADDKDILEKIAKSIIDVSLWQTYRNEEYGFELKYPQGWSVDYYTDSVRLLNQTMGVYIYINPRPVDLMNEDREYIGQTALNIKDATVAEYSTLKSRGDNTYWIEANIVGGGNSYFIATDEQPTYGLLDIYSTILSTFKFTDTPSAANWQTYRNAAYKFSFEYPRSWEITEEGGLPVLWQGSANKGVEFYTIDRSMAGVTYCEVNMNDAGCSRLNGWTVDKRDSTKIMAIRDINAAQGLMATFYTKLPVVEHILSTFSFLP